MQNNKKTTNKTIIISELFRDTAKIIRKDYIILAPYLIFFFMFYSIEHSFLLPAQSKLNLKNYKSYIMGISWFIELFFKGLTIAMAIDLLTVGQTSISTATKLVLKRFFNLVLGTGILSLPIIVLVKYLFASNTTNSGSNFLAVLLGSVFIIFASLVLEFVPIFVIGKKHNWFKSIMKSFYFVRDHFRKVMLFICLIFFIAFLSLYLGAVMGSIPVIGKAIFQTFLLGVSSAFIYIMAVIFFFKTTIKAEPEISTIR
jgi:hypothetical protein